MEVKKESLANKVYGRIRQGFFDVMLDLLREKQIGISMTTYFCRAVDSMLPDVYNVHPDRFLTFRRKRRPFLINKNIQFFKWNDQYCLSILQQIFDYIRILNAIEKAKNKTYYFLLFCFGNSYYVDSFQLLHTCS